MALIINDSWRINASVVDVNPVTTALTGNNKKFILGYSSAKATMTLNTQGVVFAEDFYSILNGDTKIWGTTHTFENVESKTSYFFAEEDNGNVHRKVLDVDTIDYTKPTCNIGSELPDGEGKMNVFVWGNFFNASFGAVSNTITVQYRYKEYVGFYGEWHDMTITTNGNTYSAQALVTGLNYKMQYTFEARVVDKLNEIPSPSIVVRAIPVFHWGENDFVFEVPVTFNQGAEGISASNEPLYINNKTYDGSSAINAEIYSGTWLPTVLIPEDDAYYSVRQGWYQKVGRVVTIGWLLKLNPDQGYESTVVKIANVPFPPAYNAFGGGVAHNIHTTIDLIFEGWAIDTSGNITARLQHGNKLETGNLEISSGAYYCGTNDVMTLAGTICYITNM